MSKNKNSTTTKFIKQFFLFPLNSMIIGTSFVILFFVYYIYFNKKELNIFPIGHNLQIDFYNDSIDGGHSTIIEHHVYYDSIINMNFILKKGFVRPYVGINLSFINNKDIDISLYNEIQIEAESQDIKNITVYLVTHNESSIVINNKHEGLFFGDNLDISLLNKRYNLNLKNFKIPDWWYDVNNLSHNLNLVPDLKHLTSINLTTGITPALDTKHLLKIHSISFIRNNTRVMVRLGFILLIIILILMTIYFFNTRPYKKNAAITINYKPVIVSKKTVSYDFLGYIHANFSNSGLSLENVSKNTGVSQHNITAYISENFNCNFKTYINLIRINEAKRLLKGTDLNISEIAFKVGFNSPNHFNRVFKKLTGDTPSGFLHKV